LAHLFGYLAELYLMARRHADLVILVLGAICVAFPASVTVCRKWSEGIWVCSTGVLSLVLIPLALGAAYAYTASILWALLVAVVLTVLVWGGAIWADRRAFVTWLRRRPPEG
jgi:hypothetical protein